MFFDDADDTGTDGGAAEAPAADADADDDAKAPAADRLGLHFGGGRKRVNNLAAAHD